MLCHDADTACVEARGASEAGQRVNLCAWEKGSCGSVRMRGQQEGRYKERKEG